MATSNSVEYSHLSPAQGGMKWEEALSVSSSPAQVFCSLLSSQCADLSTFSCTTASSKDLKGITHTDSVHSGSQAAQNHRDRRRHGDIRRDEIVQGFVDNTGRLCWLAVSNHAAGVQSE